MPKYPIIAGLAFIASIAVIQADAQGVVVTAAVTAPAPAGGAGYCPSVPAAKSSFLTTDSQAWFVFTYTGGTAGETYTIQWVTGTDEVYATNSFTQTSTGGSYCYNYFIGISGFPPATEPGTWYANLVSNGIVIASRSFTISTPPPTLVLSYAGGATCGPGTPVPCSVSGSGFIGNTIALGPSIAIASSNSTPIGFNVSTSTGNRVGANWLSVNIMSGTTPASLNISANMQGFAPGTYSGTVTITPVLAGVAAKTIAASVTVSGSDSLQVTFNPDVSQNLQLTYPSAVSGSIQVTSSNSSLAGMYFTATATILTPAGGSWLGITQNASQTNATVNIAAARGSLPYGTYSGRLDFYDTNFNDTPVTVVFVVPAPPALSAVCIGSGPAAGTCFASGSTGQTGLAVGSISVTGSDPAQPISFSVASSVSNSVGPNWLSFKISSSPVGSSIGPAPLTTSANTGTTPATVALTANLTGLSQGTYTATVTITPTSPTSNGPQFVAAAVTVTNGSLQVTWTTSQQQNQSANQVMALTSPSALTGTINVLGGGGQLSYSYDVGAGAGWLQVAPAPPAPPGSVTPGTLAVTAVPGGMQPSSQPYQGRIDILDSENNPTSVTVTLAIPGGTSSNPALQLVTVAPCRAMDTRMANGIFGGPYIAANAPRTIPVPLSVDVVTGTPCGVPANAKAYSLNFTVVPRAVTMGSLTVWPTGQQPQPVVSTLSWPDASALAAGALVPAGTGGSINVSPTQDTDLIIDINGYFVPPATNTLQFYPLPPCRVLDTRPISNGGKFPPTSPFGPPSLDGVDNRSFPIPGSCGVPANAAAYSFNLTLVPQGDLIGFVAAWPTGGARPSVSTMNGYDATVIANAAIVPAGTAGAVSFFASSPTDIVADINGYFAPPGTGGLNFYTVPSCRLVDTRNANGNFGGPTIAANTARNFPLSEGSCALPAYPALQAYSVSITAFPQGTLGFLTAYPTGTALPNASTLNAWNNQPAVANAALVPAGPANGGSLSVFVATPSASDVTIDTAGYFGP